MKKAKPPHPPKKTKKPNQKKPKKKPNPIGGCTVLFIFFRQSSPRCPASSCLVIVKTCVTAPGVFQLQPLSLFAAFVPLCILYG